MHSRAKSLASFRTLGEPVAPSFRLVLFFLGIGCPIALVGMGIPLSGTTSVVGPRHLLQDVAPVRSSQFAPDKVAFPQYRSKGTPKSWNTAGDSDSDQTTAPKNMLECLSARPPNVSPARR